MKKTTAINITFYTIGVNIIFIALLLFLPALQDALTGPVGFLTPFITLVLLGILLLALVRKEPKSPKKRDLLIIGSCSVLFFSFIALHNGFYAFGELTDNNILQSIFGFLEGLFFLLAIPTTPAILIIFYIKRLIQSAHKR